MKKKFPIFSIISMLSFTIVFNHCNSESDISSLPQIKNVDRYTAEITWETKKSLQCVVTCYQEGKEHKKFTEEKAAFKHAITLTGLLPDKQYYYKINTLPEREFNFRTAPLSTKSFRFCVINNDLGSSTIIEQIFPDFLIIGHADSAFKCRSSDKLSEIHTRIPFYDIHNSFSWGNLIFNKSLLVDSNYTLHKADSITLTICDTFSGDSLGVNKTTGRIFIFPDGDSACVLSDSLATLFFMANQSMLFEVQGDEISAGIIGLEPDKPLPFHLKKGVLSYTKTCVLCRSLLEDKQYAKSITYYKKFIDENPEQKLHDNALFHIADIYDRYLFDYPDAIVAYSQLLERYPQSSYSATARIRLDYIKQHSDFDYNPLKTFEKARLQFDKSYMESSIKMVEDILVKYSACSLRDDILLWLGNSLAEKERKGAIKYLTYLGKETDNDDKKYKASLKIGDIYYWYKMYFEALNVYQDMLKAYPDKSETLQIKINRAIRNQNRKIWLWISSIFLITLVSIICVLPDKGLKLPRIKIVLPVGCIYLILFLIPFLFYYDYLVTLKIFATSLGVSMILVLYFSWLLAVKLAKMSLPLIVKITINGMTTLMITLFVLFIHLYFFHYIFIFERVLQ